MQARRERELQEYFQGVARARYVMRKVVRIVDELARDARLIGYVRPGEHLFIVKGTAEWKRQHAARR